MTGCDETGKPRPKSYNSALERVVAPNPPVTPPATRIFPLVISVAEWLRRPVVNEPVVVHVPDAGLYNSALGIPAAIFDPPTTSTCPLARSVAVCENRN